MNWFLAKRYIKYQLFSWHKNGHGVHSPYIYQLVKQVFNDTKEYVPYSIIKAQRKKLLTTATPISVTDFGAKSNLYTKTRTVSDITKGSSIRNKYGQLLYRLSAFANPETIVELGSSVGLSASWMALAVPNAQIYSIEGCDRIATLAQNTISELQCNNVTIINGQFEAQLSPTLEKIKKLDFVYIDGNHTYENTICYFNQILRHSHENTIIILDDIHWSQGMDRAWKEICANNQVSQTIDILQWGIVFLRKGVAKEDFIIRY